MDVVEDVHFLIGQGDKVAHQLGVEDADDAVVELEELGAVAGVRNVVARSGRSSHMRHERLQAIPMAVALQHVIAKDFAFKDIAFGLPAVEGKKKNLRPAVYVCHTRGVVISMTGVSAEWRFATPSTEVRWHLGMAEIGIQGLLDGVHGSVCHNRKLNRQEFLGSKTSLEGAVATAEPRNFQPAKRRVQFEAVAQQNDCELSCVLLAVAIEEIGQLRRSHRPTGSAESTDDLLQGHLQVRRAAAERGSQSRDRDQCLQRGVDEARRPQVDESRRKCHVLEVAKLEEVLQA